MDIHALSERDIGTKFVTPALKGAWWDEMLQIREEVSLTKERVVVRGKLVSCGTAKRADYILYYKPYVPIAPIEAKETSCAVGNQAGGHENVSRAICRPGRSARPGARERSRVA